MTRRPKKTETEHIDTDTTILDPVCGEGDESPITAEPGAVNGDVAQLQAELVEKDAKIEQLTDAYKRQMADYQNLKRRTQQQMDEIGQYKLEGIAKKLLGVVDNFERAMKVDVEAATVGSVIEGIQMVHAQLMKILSDEGVEPIEAVGQEFDPNLHEAMMRVAAEEGVDDDTVVMELERGYTLNKRVIRPSKVSVAKSN